MIDIINNKASISESIVNISEGLDILPSRNENAVLDNFFMLNKFPLERVYFDLIHQVFNKYDLVLFDCPLALGQSVAAATLVSDIVIAPVTPEQFSLSGLRNSATKEDIDLFTREMLSLNNLKIDDKFEG
ncbi:parA family protein MG470-like [Hydra vulgaris]|uniref:parA family protein MG470-like n=1 Tax=Hydra vulgaris TaxID=6087 RepID=UPI001F5F4CF2|nr:parA family protein MG470-like [Hydra vulgaris]